MTEMVGIAGRAFQSSKLNLRKIKIQNGLIYLAWDLVPGAAFYRIYRQKKVVSIAGPNATTTVATYIAGSLYEVQALSELVREGIQT
jgi:hypothetical protein